MPSRLDVAMDRLRTLPAHRQDDVAEMLIALVDQDGAGVDLSDEQIAEIERRLADPADGPANDLEVAALYARFGR